MESADVAQERCIARRPRADDGPPGAGLEDRLDSAEVAQAATDLDRDRGHRDDDLRDERALARFACERAVEVDDVKPSGAELLPAERGLQRVVREDGLLVAAALTEAHAPAVPEIDGRDDDHAPSFTIAAKFSSMRSPHRWLFSGWNWVA